MDFRNSFSVLKFQISIKFECVNVKNQVFRKGINPPPPADKYQGFQDTFFCSKVSSRNNAGFDSIAAIKTKMTVYIDIKVLFLGFRFENWKSLKKQPKL